MTFEPLQLLPQPRQIDVADGVLRLPATLSLSGADADPICKTILAELSARRMARNGDVALLPPAGTSAGLAKWARLPEGFALEVDERSIRIHASQPAGHLYGAMTLRQLRQQFGTVLPRLRIGDAPVMRRRGQQLSLVQGHTAYRPGYFRHLVPQLARWKINELYVYLETAFDFPSLPGVGGPGAMTPADARALRHLCRAYGMKLIPMINLLGHNAELLALQRYHGLQECEPKLDVRATRGMNLCPSLPETQRLVAAQLRDIAAAFQPELIHVGGDEVYDLGVCPRCAPRAAKVGKIGVYLQHYERVVRLAAELGCKVGLWGDMLLHYKKELNLPANRASVARLRRGAVVFDWHYNEGSPEAAAFFVRRGFETVMSSSTCCCVSTAVWLGQSENQRLLFRDGQNARAVGGMTSSWFNMKGQHEEQCNYLFATGAAMLWSGASANKGEMSPGWTRATFERAYNRQRYGTTSMALTRFWHHIGDAGGPVLTPLAPLQAANLRECLYHTDNLLTFWRQYAALLAGPGLAKYRTAVRDARRLWKRVEADLSKAGDPYLPLQVGPLLLHEHLLKRYETIEAVYALYDQAARRQLKNKAKGRALLAAAAQRLMQHRADFPPVLAYLDRCTERFGLERYSRLRVQGALDQVSELAAYLRGLAASPRALPAFHQLESVLLGPTLNHEWIDREHEWANEAARFRRFSRFPSAWDVEWQFAGKGKRQDKE